MNDFAAIANQIHQTVLQCKKIVIISHRNPDADTVGSNLALRDYFESLGIIVDSVSEDPAPPNCDFLPKNSEFRTSFSPEDYNAYVAVDAGSIEQTGFSDLRSAITSGAKPFVNIDHHPSNKGYGTINLVIPDAAATTLIIYDLFKEWHVEITPLRATYLLVGLYYDTGSFMHSNTDAKVCDMASDLLEKGADFNSIVKNLFKDKSVKKLKLWGEVLSKAKLNDDKVATSVALKEDFKKLGATSEDLSGIIDYLSSVKDAEYASLISNESPDTVRGSLRTRRDDIDVAEIAKSLGGGGHKKASGYSFKGHVKATDRWHITRDESAGERNSK